MSSDWPILTKLRCKLLRGCYTQATYLATLRKAEDRSTFLATRNATIAVAKWGVTREFFLETCNATFVALQVARKIASCNMAFKACCFRVASSSISAIFLPGHAQHFKAFLALIAASFKIFVYVLTEKLISLCLLMTQHLKDGKLFSLSKCLATKHHNTLFDDQTFYRLATLSGAV